MYPRLLALLLIAGSLAAAATGASAPSEPPIVSAGAHGLSILVPGQPVSVAAEATAPGPAATGVADGFVFPADGSLVRTGALSSSVSSRATGTAGSQAVSDVLGVTLFNGEVTAESAAARAKATGTGADATGSKLVNLVVFGTPVAATPNLRVALGDWGYLVALEQVADAPVADGTRNARGAVNALHVVLTADHGGLPAGTEILVAHAEAAVSSPVDTTTATQPATTTGKAQSGARRTGTKEAAAEAAGGRAAPEQARFRLPDSADGRLGAALAEGLRLPRLRRVVVQRHLRSSPGGRRLASRPGHLRAARDPAPGRRRRDDLLGRLERPRRLPAVAA